MRPACAGVVLAFIALLAAPRCAVALPIVEPGAVINLTDATVYGDVGHISALTSAGVTFHSLDGYSSSTELYLIPPVNIPETATYLMFEVLTLLQDGVSPFLGGVQLWLDYVDSDALGKIVNVQGTYGDTLAIQLDHPGRAAVISIHFSGGVYEAGEFTAGISGLRFVDDPVLPERMLQSSYTPVPEPSTVCLLGVGFIGFACRTLRRRH